MITLTGQLICTTAEECAIVTRHLPEHIRLSRAEPGCLRFDVVQTADPMVWQVDESFADAAAFEAHQTRSRASLWHEKTLGIRRSFTPLGKTPAGASGLPVRDPAQSASG